MKKGFLNSKNFYQVKSGFNRSVAKRATSKERKHLNTLLRKGKKGK